MQPLPSEEVGMRRSPGWAGKGQDVQAGRHVGKGSKGWVGRWAKAGAQGGQKV